MGPLKAKQKKQKKIDSELLTRANVFGGGYQPLEEQVEEEDQEPQQPETIEEAEAESEGESQINRDDNFPIVDLKAKKQSKRPNSTSCST